MCMMCVPEHQCLDPHAKRWTCISESGLKSASVRNLTLAHTLIPPNGQKTSRHEETVLLKFATHTQGKGISQRLRCYEYFAVDLACTVSFKEKKKKDFTSFCQPTQPIACANYGNLFKSS